MKCQYYFIATQSLKLINESKYMLTYAMYNMHDFLILFINFYTHTIQWKASTCTRILKLYECFIACVICHYNQTLSLITN